MEIVKQGQMLALMPPFRLPDPERSQYPEEWGVSGEQRAEQEVTS